MGPNQTNKLLSDLDINDMDIFSAKKLREKLSSRISRIRSKDTIRIQTTISAEKKTALRITIDWLYEHELIKSKSRYAFLQFAVENTIKQVLNQRQNDELQRQAELDRISQEGPSNTSNIYSPINAT